MCPLSAREKTLMLRVKGYQWCVGGADASVMDEVCSFKKGLWCHWRKMILRLFEMG